MPAAAGAVKAFVTIGSQNQPYGRLPLRKTVNVAARLSPVLADMLDLAWALPASQQLQQRVATGPLTLGDHLDPAVLPVGRRADQAQLQRPGPGPPPETDALHPPGDGRRQPCGGATHTLQGRSVLVPHSTALTAHPCRSLCDWQPSRAARRELPLWACTGCGSQWDSSQGWSPRQADGSWPPGVQAELRR